MDMEKFLSDPKHFLSSPTQTITFHFLLHSWLIIFMTSVGLLKFLGYLPHSHSRLVGFLELISGSLFLPGFKFAANILSVETLNLYIMGCSSIMIALGLVTSDRKKRFSVVCWVHVALVLLFVGEMKLERLNLKNEMFDLETEINPLIILAGFFVYGHFIGRVTGQRDGKAVGQPQKVEASKGNKKKSA